MKNKGFSLVELIIVIAIMAILAAAIAPALIRYIDKSRKADDVTAAGTIESSVSAALANETAYDEVTKLVGTSTDYVVVAYVDGSSSAKGTYADVTAKTSGNYFKKELQSSLTSGAKVKYTKDGAVGYTVAVNGNGTIGVYIADKADATTWMIRPSMTDLYK